MKRNIQQAVFSDDNRGIGGTKEIIHAKEVSRVPRWRWRRVMEFRIKSVQVRAPLDREELRCFPETEISKIESFSCLPNF